jgi:hypothetical protein
MIYRELKRTNSNGYLNYIPRFREEFPELSKLDSEELAQRFRRLNLEFYYEKQKPVKFWVRLTLPFALITYLIMFFSLPLNFIISGEWGYSFNEKNFILNWLRSLRLNF